MRQYSTYIVLTVLLLTLGGCRFGPVKDRDIEGADGQTGTTQEGGGQGISGNLGSSAIMEELNDPNSPLSKRVLYFDFDSSKVTDEQREIIDAHAAFLSNNPDVSIVLEGHADERGTREYNLALGERRAKAVEQLLLVQGVAPDQIQVISFGEERPVALENNESAWRLNRRVEILYSGF